MNSLENTDLLSTIRSICYPCRRMSDEGPTLAERSGYAQLGSTFGGDPDAVRPRNANALVNAELRANSIARRHKEESATIL